MHNASRYNITELNSVNFSRLPITPYRVKNTSKHTKTLTTRSQYTKLRLCAPYHSGWADVLCPASRALAKPPPGPTVGWPPCVNQYTAELAAGPALRRSRHQRSWQRGRGLAAKSEELHQMLDLVIIGRLSNRHGSLLKGGLRLLPASDRLSLIRRSMAIADSEGRRMARFDSRESRTLRKSV